MMPKSLINLMLRLLKEESGASLAEYALVLGMGSVIATMIKPSLEQVTNHIHSEPKSEFDHFKEFGHN